MLTKHAQSLLDYLERSKGVIQQLLIVPHHFPDPDACASAFALKYLVEKAYGIQAKIGHSGLLGRMENRAMVKLLKIPLRKLLASDWKRYQHVALVDTQPAFENNPFPRKRRATIVIDQHPSVEPVDADLAIVDEKCGATSALLAKALLLKGIEMPTNLATALAYGILTDTMNLYRCKEVAVIETYLSVLASADLVALAKIQNAVRPREFFRELSKGLANAHARGRLIFSHLHAVKSPDMVAQLADFLLTYEGVSWAFCTGRYRGQLCLSLRADHPKAQAGEVLRDVVPDKSNAGGHGVIAGGAFRVKERDGVKLWNETEAELVQKLTRRLKIAGASKLHKIV